MKVIKEQIEEPIEEIKFPCLMEKRNTEGYTLILATDRALDGTYSGIALAISMDALPQEERDFRKLNITHRWSPDFKPCKAPITLIND